MCARAVLAAWLCSLCRGRWGWGWGHDLKQKLSPWGDSSAGQDRAQRPDSWGSRDRVQAREPHDTGGVT